MTVIRPSADLRNHYSDLSKMCRENREPIYITVNGRGDTVLMGLAEYERMRGELELLRVLAEAENDVQEGRVGSMDETFAAIRRSLMDKKREKNMAKDANGGTADGEGCI